MGVRRKRFDLRRRKANESRKYNGFLKESERQRREKRLVELVKKAGTLDGLTPTIKSWLSVELNKPAHRLTAEDLAAVAARAV